MKPTYPFYYTHSGDANLDVDAQHGLVIIATHNLGAERSIGLPVNAGYDVGTRIRIVRQSASPAAYALLVKSGTAASGTQIGSVVASKNGFVEAMFNGVAWVEIGTGVAS